MDRSAYQIAIICALPVELACVQGMLDETFEGPPHNPGDENTYIYGRIANHNLVLACLPKGEYGTVSAASVAGRVRQSFPTLRFALMVGIGAGVPSTTHDIRLGDIVVGTPNQTSSGVVAHDTGKSIQEGKFVRTGTFNRPPEQLLIAVSALEAKHIQAGFDPSQHMSAMTARFPNMQQTHIFPGRENDRLFEADYKHEHGHIQDCAQCDLSRIIARPPRHQQKPVVHFGTIASGDKLIRDAEIRDTIAIDMDALCFEMEAAGLKNIPCLVIRGICDYADSHKTKQWQPYAAMVAAAYAKDLLPLIPAVTTQSKSNMSLEPPNLQCLKDLNVSDPREDRMRILATKDPLLSGSCDWVFEDDACKTWWEAEHCKILWVHGDPGKGKTMIAMAAIGEISSRSSLPSSPLCMAYFFCQGNISGQNEALSVIKGLIYFLATDYPVLTHHLEERWKRQDRNILFNGPSALYSLWAILNNMLRDSACPVAVLIIDALDECTTGLTELLELICTTESKAKWLLTSRNIDQIKDRILSSDAIAHTSLEVNSKHVGSSIQSFIEWKVDKLAKEKKYNTGLQTTVEEHLKENAHGTFLWVALVCKELQKVTRISAHHKLEQFPPELQPLYERMLDQVLEDGHSQIVEHKLRLLRLICISFEPRHLQEVGHACDLPNEFANDADYIEDLVATCGSFLVVQSGRVLFVHPSARDYLISSHGSRVLGMGLEHAHGQFAGQCLHHISSHLTRDICNLSDPAASVNDVDVETLSHFLPYHLRYASKHWINHYLAAKDTLSLTSLLTQQVQLFLYTHFLIWLEALSLIGCLSDGVLGLWTLKTLFEHSEPRIYAVVNDGLRLIGNNRITIETFPLQLYNSVLMFSPAESIVKQLYLKSVPEGILQFPPVDETWTACLLSLEGHKQNTTLVIFSPDGMLFATASSDHDSSEFFQDIQNFGLRDHYGSIDIWDSNSGELRLTFETKEPIAEFGICFQPPTGQYIAVAYRSGTIDLWDVRRGALKRTFRSGRLARGGIAFSRDGALLAWTSWRGRTVWWDIEKNDILREFLPPFPSEPELQSDLRYMNKLRCRPSSVSQNAELVASVRQFNKVNLCDWNGKSKSIESPSEAVLGIVVSSNSEILAMLCNKRQTSDAGILTVKPRIEIWEVSTGLLRTHFQEDSTWLFLQRYIEKYDKFALHWLALSPQGNRLALLEKRLIKIRDTTSGELIAELESRYLTHGLYPTMQWFPNSVQLATITSTPAVSVWNTTSGELQYTILGHSEISSMAISPDGSRLAIGSKNGNVRVWDTASAQLNPMYRGHRDEDIRIVFSPDGRSVASYSLQGPTVFTWNTISAANSFIRRANHKVCKVAFSNDSTYAAIGYSNGEIKLHQNHGEAYVSLKAVRNIIETLIFSEDNRKLLSISKNHLEHTFQVWNLSMDDVLCTSYASRTFSTLPIWISSTGDYFATLEYRLFSIWNTATGDYESCYIDQSSDYSNQREICLSPDRRYLVVYIASNFRFEVWDLNSPRAGYPRNIGNGQVNNFTTDVFFECPDCNLAIHFGSTTNGDRFRCSYVDGPINTIFRKYADYSIEESGSWIYRCGKRWLWLPHDYRTAAYAIRHGVIALAFSPEDVRFIRCKPIDGNN